MSDTWEVRYKFNIENPSDVRLRLAMTMRLKEWAALKVELDKCTLTNSVYELKRAIVEMIGHAERSFL